MAIKLNDVVKLAKGAHSLPALRSVVFDGQSAITAAQLDWMVGVPCLQLQAQGGGRRAPGQRCADDRAA